MQHKYCWYLSIILLVLAACTGGENNQQGSSGGVSQSQLRAEYFLPEPEQSPATSCDTIFYAGQYVQPKWDMPLHFIDDSLVSYGFSDLYPGEVLYLLAHVNCYGQNPVWEVELLETGQRGLVMERSYDGVQMEIDGDYEADRIPRQMLNITSHCRMNVGGASHAGTNQYGEWMCGGSQGVGLFERVYMDDVCRFVYGSATTSENRQVDFRPYAFQTNPANPETWVCLANPAPVVRDGFVQGSDQPFSDRYILVPSPVRSGSIPMYLEPNENSAHFGALENLQYYALWRMNREWTGIATPNGATGWIHSNLVVVGNNVSTNTINIQQVLNNPNTAVNVYSDDALPNRYDEAHDYMIDELGRDTGNASSLAWFAVESASGRTNAVDMLCTLVDTTADYQQILAGEELSIACVGISLGQGALTLLQGGTPIGAYITVSEVVLDNLGPFIRYNDRLWMDEMNRQVGSCFFTTLFIGETNACRH